MAQVGGVGWRNAQGRGRGRSGQYENDLEYQLNILVRGLQRAIFQALLEDINGQLNDNLRQRIREGLYVYSNEMYKSVEDRQAFELMHAKLASDIQDAVVKAYDKSKIGKRPSYRYNDTGKLRRFANKRLKKALADERLIQSDYRGLALFNTDILDKAAPQWYRLNFGAQPATTPPKTFRDMMFGKHATGMNINMNHYEPSNPFFVPSSMTTKGFGSSQAMAKSYYGDKTPSWRRHPGGPYLYLVGGRAPFGFESRLSKGIVGARFLDEGMRVFNRDYGKMLSKQFNDWHAKAVASGRIAAQKPAGGALRGPGGIFMKTPKAEEATRNGEIAVQKFTPEQVKAMIAAKNRPKWGQYGGK